MRYGSMREILVHYRDCLFIIAKSSVGVECADFEPQPPARCGIGFRSRRGCCSVGGVRYGEAKSVRISSRSAALVFAWCFYNRSRFAFAVTVS